MRLLKRNSILSVVDGMVVDYPCPSNISYLWNFGSLLGVCLVVQILTGVFLAMHYTPHVDLAFLSTEHIVRDVNNGWLLRYGHANGASMFFIMVYIHIARGMYYGSYTRPRILAWNVGVIILFLMMGIAFMGYVLPWGQMSYWGATVITNLVSAIPKVGDIIVQWLWGGFSVDNATLNRFFSLHYLLPFVLAGLVLLHLAALHINRSNNPIGLESNVDQIRFNPYFIIKDLLGFLLFFAFFGYFVFFSPNYLGHPDNYIPANPLVTPPHIQPEWYFLFAYAILRSIPNKLAGVVALVLSILVLLVMPFVHTSRIRSSTFRPISRMFYWFFVANFFLLTWIGGMPVEDPYILIGQLSGLFYFSYFLLIIPFLGWLENKLLEL